MELIEKYIANIEKTAKIIDFALKTNINVKNIKEKKITDVKEETLVAINYFLDANNLKKTFDIFSVDNVNSKNGLEIIEINKLTKLQNDLLDILKCCNESYILNDFKSIEYALDVPKEYNQEYKFSYKEKLDIILYFIKKNIENGILNNKSYLNLHYLWKNFYSKFTYPEFKEFLTFINNNKKEIDSKELEYYNKALEETKHFSLNNRKTIVAHKNIQKHLLDNQDLSLLDVKFIIVSFKTLGISDNLGNILENILTKQIKPKKEEKEIISLNVPIYFDEKENNKIYREIMSYYDIDNHKVYRELTLNKIIYLVSLMKKINVKERDIIKFIQNVNKESLEAYPNKFQKLYEYYPKLQQYASIETMTNLNEILKNLYTMQSKEDYYFYQELFIEYLKIALNEVKYIYEYELNEGLNR